MRRLLVSLLLVTGALLPVIPAHASTDIACSTGAFKPKAYGTAQVRGVGDIDCWGADWAAIEVTVWISNDGYLGIASNHTCTGIIHYCSWYKIQNKGAGYNCYRSVADGAVKDFNGNWYNLPAATSGPLCTS